MHRRAPSPAFRHQTREAGGTVTTNGKIEVFGTIDAVPKDYQNSKFARGESALAIPAAETGVGAAPCGFFFVVRGHHARARPPRAGQAKELHVMGSVLGFVGADEIGLLAIPPRNPFVISRMRVARRSGNDTRACAQDTRTKIPAKLLGNPGQSGISAASLFRHSSGKVLVYRKSCGRERTTIMWSRDGEASICRVTLRARRGGNALSAVDPCKLSERSPVFQVCLPTCDGR
jgi:hypothetical protein